MAKSTRITTRVRVVFKDGHVEEQTDTWDLADKKDAKPKEIKAIVVPQIMAKRGIRARALTEKDIKEVTFRAW